MDFNRRMRSSNVQGFASKVLTLYEEEGRRRRIRKRLCSAVRPYAHAQFNFYIVFLCNGIHNIPLLLAVTEKRVSVPEAHKRYFYLPKIKYLELNLEINYFILLFSLLFYFKQFEIQRFFYLKFAQEIVVKPNLCELLVLKLCRLIVYLRSVISFIGKLYFVT